MSSADVLFSPVRDLAPRIARGDLRATDLLDACIEQIEQYEPDFNAFIMRTLDRAREQAATLDREAQQGQVRGPLHGIPIAVKDVFDIEGLATTAGSKILEGRVAKATGTAVKRLIGAGAVIVGKTNMDEFARGGTTLDSNFGPTPNPWNRHHTPGGSSSGSAVAVATGMALAAIGADTGGSVVGPAAFCNLAGIRPTFGRVSRNGVVPLGPSFDTIGPLTRTVEDAALMLQVMAGPDPLDAATGVAAAPTFLGDTDGSLEGVSIGVPTNYVWPGYEPEVQQVVRAAIQDLKALGARIVDVELPWADVCRAVYNAVVGFESAQYHREYLRERRDDYVSPGADFFETGLFVPAWRYVQAQRGRTLLMRQAAEVFRRVDAIVAPTSPIAPPSFEACKASPVVQALISHCKRPFSPLGAPVLELPVGFTAGLPVGMQVVGRWGQEALLFRIGVAYEKMRPWWKLCPPLDKPPAQVAGFSDWARAAEEEVPGGNVASLTEEQVRAQAAAIGHRVQPKRLKTLTRDVNRELVRFAALDSLPLDDCPRADELNLLELDVRHFPLAAPTAPARP